MIGEIKPPAQSDSLKYEDPESTNAEGALRTEEPDDRTAKEFSFGPFRLCPAQRLLLDGDRPVRIGSRSLDLLIALVERQGQVVSKEILFARVWPSTFVDEGNLKVQMAALRRSLGDGQSGNRYVATVPGRGYCFVAPVIRLDSPQPAMEENSNVPSRINVPKPLARLVGIDTAVTRISELLTRHRLITLAGPGGIGKTSTAIATAGQIADRYEDGIWLIDLAAINDPRFLIEIIGSVMGLNDHTKRSTAEVLAHLSNKRMLILLDSCEHLIDDVAILATRMIQAAPGLHILATSREPLSIDGEHVYHVQALALPTSSHGLGVAGALDFPAIQLFVERAADVLGGFDLAEVDVPAVIEICRKLDGMPLAIEFAAASMPAFGLQGVVSGADHPLQLSGIARRDVPARHRTLRATLDWSYTLLSDEERRVLARLSILPGTFSVERAVAIATEAGEAKSEMADQVISLVAKSLIAVSVCGSDSRLRLQSATRAYAAERLRESCDRGTSKEVISKEATMVGRGRDLSSTGRLIQH